MRAASLWAGGLARFIRYRWQGATGRGNPDSGLESAGLPVSRRGSGRTCWSKLRSIGKSTALYGFHRLSLVGAAGAGGLGGAGDDAHVGHRI